MTNKQAYAGLLERLRSFVTQTDFQVIDTMDEAAEAISSLLKRVGELEGALSLARNTVGDLRRGFARSVEPSRWVEQLQAHIDAALNSDA